MSARWPIAVVLAAAFALPGLTSSAVAAPCDADACGAPVCSNPHVRVRPGVTREVFVQCRESLGASLETPPEHATVSDVKIAWGRVTFTVRADADAPRYLDATLAVQGHERTIDLPVTIEVIPVEENQPPRCDGDRATSRSDGHAPVDFFLHPWCSDPDGDDFVVEGGGPGSHALSPKHVASGDGESNWPYRTGGTEGNERAPIWATDSLGARSETAYLDVTFGPGIDRLPTCRPNPSGWTSDGVQVVRTRAGRPRRFGLICNDEDGDELTAAVTGAPTRGQLPRFEPSAPSSGFWGLDRWYDATYIPADAHSDRDVFEVTPTGARGTGPATRIALDPQPDATNGGGGCGWSPASIVRDRPGVLSIRCDDDEGDPLLVEVTGEPRHGTVGAPVAVPAAYGGTDMTIPYVPEPGYVGYDCVQVVVRDDHGSEMKLQVDIDVHAEAVPQVPAPPLPIDVSVPWLPSLPAPVKASAGTPVAAPPSSAAVSAALQQALETSGTVERLAAPAGAQVWAPKTLSRRTLLRSGRVPGVLVLCTTSCRISSRTALRVGKALGQTAGASRSTVLQAAAGRPNVLWLSLDRRQQASLRQASRAAADFRLRLKVGSAKERAVRRTVPVGAG